MCLITSPKILVGKVGNKGTEFKRTDLDTGLSLLQRLGRSSLLPSRCFVKILKLFVSVSSVRDDESWASLICRLLIGHFTIWNINGISKSKIF